MSHRTIALVALLSRQTRDRQPQRSPNVASNRRFVSQLALRYNQVACAGRDRAYGNMEKGT